MNLSHKILPLCAAVAFACAAPVHADELLLSHTTLNFFGLGNSDFLPGDVNTLSVPSSSTYGNGFGSPAFLAPLVGAPDYDFADYYYLSIPAGVANGSTISIDLGQLLNLDSLHVNLFSGHSTTLNPAAVISSVDSVITDPNYSVNVSVLNETFLAAGDYTLQVLGNVTGFAGASYGGTLNLAPAPVPVPAAVWLLGSALTSVVSIRRRKDA